MKTNSSPLSMYLLLAGEAFANLMAVAQRSVLALIGIVIGTASVIAMLDVGHTAEAESIRQFKSMGTDLIIAQVHLGQDKKSPPRVSVVESIPQSLSAIRKVAAVAISGESIGRKPQKQVTLIGATATLADVLKLQTAQGRFLSRYEHNQTFIVIGHEIARINGANAPQLQPGDQLRLGSYLFTIIGVLDETSRNPLVPFTIDTSIILPHASIGRIAPHATRNTFLASAKDTIDAGKAATALENELRRLHHGKRVTTQNARQLIANMQNQARVMSTLLAAIGGISLLVGGVGVMNVMLMNVAERRREIGLRMALGARRSHIRAMFLMESATLSFSGGVLGTLLGMSAAFVYAHFAGWNFTPSPFSVPLGVSLSVGIGLFFGSYPAAKAARQNPVQALRAD